MPDCYCRLLLHDTMVNDDIELVLLTVLTNSKVKGSGNITESLLLSPTCYQSISKKEDRHIKEAVFEFITSVDRKKSTRSVFPMIGLYTEEVSSKIAIT